MSLSVLYLACQTEMLPLRENQIILLILVELMTITVDICGIDDHQFKFSFHNHREI